jgi:hypothetical protein
MADIPISSFRRIAGPLGLLLIEFNGLEMDAALLVARLLKQDDVTAAALGGSLSFSQKIGLIETLVPLKVPDGEICAEIRAVVKRARDVNAERNRFVHSEYFMLLDENDDEYGTLYRRLRDATKLVVRGDDVHNLSEVSRGQLSALTQKVVDLGHDIRAVAEKFMDWFGEGQAPQ